MERGLLTFSIIGSLLIIFLTVPIIVCLALGAPGLPSLAGDEEALRAICLSFHAGSIASMLVACLGTPLAYFLSRSKWPSTIKGLLESLIEAPLALPHSVAGMMVLLTYNPKSPIGSILARVGLAVEDNYWGIVFVMAFVSAPIFVSTVKAGFDSIDVELENVARTLGARLFRTFVTVTFPLTFRHFLAGFILTLARAVSEVGAIMVVAYYPKVASVLVVERFLNYGLRAALTLSAALTLVSLAMFASLKFLGRR